MGEHADPVEVAAYILTAADRCDGCGARAYARVTVNPAKADLHFCKHHFDKHLAKLLETAIDVVNETDALNPKPEVVAKSRK